MTQYDPTQSRLAMALYTKILKIRLVHALVAPTSLKTEREVKRMRKDDCVELELTVTTTYMDKFATKNSTHAMLSKKFFQDLIWSSISFLLNTRIIDVQLDETKIKFKMDFLQKCVVVSWKVTFYQINTHVSKAFEIKD